MGPWQSRRLVVEVEAVVEGAVVEVEGPWSKSGHGQSRRVMVEVQAMVEGDSGRRGQWLKSKGCGRSRSVVKVEGLWLKSGRGRSRKVMVKVQTVVEGAVVEVEGPWMKSVRGRSRRVVVEVQAVVEVEAEQAGADSRAIGHKRTGGLPMYDHQRWFTALDP